MLKKIKSKLFPNKFPGSKQYWEQRYFNNGNSGSGSYEKLAEFKANTINNIIAMHQIAKIIEFGSGDGNQLALFKVANYIGLDVSETIIKKCIFLFRNDKSKSFFLYNPFCFADNCQLFKAELTISLDVIFHLVEEEVYHLYMSHLFDASDRFVLIYSSNLDIPHIFHEKHRVFTNWIAENRPNFKLVNKILNPYPYNNKDPNNTSLADFYLFEKNKD